MMPATATRHLGRVAKTSTAVTANANVGAGRRSVNANKTNKLNVVRGHATTATTTVNTPVVARRSGTKATASTRRPVNAEPADAETCALLLAFFRKADLTRLYSREKTLVNDLRSVVRRLVTERDAAHGELQALRCREMETHEVRVTRRDSFASTTSTSSVDEEPAVTLDTIPAAPTLATSTTAPTTMFEKMAQGHADDPLMSLLWNGLRDDPALASLHAPISGSGSSDDLVSRVRCRVRAMKETKKSPPVVANKAIAAVSSATTFELMAKGNATDPELLIMWEGLRDDPAFASLHTPSDVVARMRTHIQAKETTVKIHQETTKSTLDFSSDPELDMMWHGLRDDPVLSLLHAPAASVAEGTDLLSRIRRKVALAKEHNAKIAAATRLREETNAVVTPTRAELEIARPVDELLHEAEGLQLSTADAESCGSLPASCCASSVDKEAGNPTPTPMTSFFDTIARGHANDRLQSFLWEGLRNDPALASLHTPMATTSHGEDLLSRIRRKVRETKAKPSYRPSGGIHMEGCRSLA